MLRQLNKPKKFFPWLIICLGLAWIVVNIFYLPFSVWTGGLYTPWLIIKGLTPYKDFVWLRTPLDIYLLAGLYQIFSLTEMTYQITIFVLYVLISLILLIFSGRKSFTFGVIAFTAYVFLLFPLFINTEIGEILVSLFVLIAFICFWRYVLTKKESWIFCSGLTLGLAFITKHTSALLVLLVPVLLIFEHYKHRNRKEIIVSIITFFLAFLVIVLGLIFYLLVKGALIHFIYYGVFFNLVIYRQWVGAWGIGDAFKMIGLYLSIMLPFLIMRNSKIMNLHLRIYLASFILALLLSLMPSFWSYRLITAFPLISLALAVVITEIFKAIRQTRQPVIFFGLTMIISTFIFFNHYLQIYLNFIGNNNFGRGQYIRDYGENEIRTANWLITHTPKEETIFNMANNIILLRSQRLPHNKYIDALPHVYDPPKKSFVDIIKTPPKIVIFDDGVPDNRLTSAGWERLRREWGFFDYLKNNYALEKEFGKIKIYKIKN